jgi:hypothetical protein
MAQRRMFSKSITNSSQFLMMPSSSQNLYFHLGMNADDDGFCEHFSLMRMTDSKPDDLKILQAKGFVSVFDDKVLVISDWKENNYLRSDRYTPSKYLHIYKDELARLSSGIPVVDKVATQVRLGKVRKGKNTTTETSSDAPFDWDKYLQGMIDHTRKDLNIIGFFFKTKGVVFNTKEKASVGIRRHMKAARELSVFDKKEIGDKIRKLNYDFPKFTLETVIKELTK